MDPRQIDRALDGLSHFLRTPLDQLIDPRRRTCEQAALTLFTDVVARVPAYRQFLAENGVNPEGVRTLDDFTRLPLATKPNYVQKYPLASRCRDGALDRCDTLAMSSGSTGEPTVWPRFVSDELAVAVRFEQVFFDSFEADRKTTLAVVCFPLGTWVGGMFTTACCRHLAAKGYPITVVAAGNQKQEILRVVRELGPLYEQVVLLGYPPFVKDVVDTGLASGVRWPDYKIKLVLAGEVFSEEWRALMGERCGLARPLHDSASLYGTADAGVLANETPLSIAIRRFFAQRPDDARALFGEARLPTLAQYDPLTRMFEVHEGTLLFSGDNGVPLVRYHINDQGGLVEYDEMLAFLGARGFDPVAEVRRFGERGARPLPFVYVFGRSHFAVSYYGANIFPETVAIGLEQPHVKDWVTGKFVMEVREDAERNRQLTIAVELAPDAGASEERRALAADSILASLLRLNSEFANYVPAERRRPEITLWPAGDPNYFPVGVKHRYSRR
jgi:phenylacetate-CoA ligase